MSDERVGLYPGTFDPITNGHLDIITRAATHMVDRLIVGVAENEAKGPMFPLQERIDMVRAEVSNLPPAAKASIEVRGFKGLLMDFAVRSGASQVIRGLRAVSDFEYEFQMASMNARMNPNVETVFLMASDRNQFIASKLVKEIARFGGDVRQFVPARVGRLLYERIASDAPPDPDHWSQKMYEKDGERS